MRKQYELFLDLSILVEIGSTWIGHTGHQRDRNAVLRRRVLYRRGHVWFLCVRELRHIDQVGGCLFVVHVCLVLLAGGCLVKTIEIGGWMYD